MASLPPPTPTTSVPTIPPPPASTTPSPPLPPSFQIIDVWSTNLHSQFSIIRQLIKTHPYISMDTEFPGVVARPIMSRRTNNGNQNQKKEGVNGTSGGETPVGSLTSPDKNAFPPPSIANGSGTGSIGAQQSGPSEFHYQTLRCNVDILKLIQLGLTLTDSDGLLPDQSPLNSSSSSDTSDANPNPIPEALRGKGYGCWQFNFKFDLSQDMYHPTSIDLLQNSGLDFERHQKEGIDVREFAYLLIGSGLVLLDEGVNWVSFHSGYDFGYLLKTLTALPLPETETEFFDLLSTWFPRIYDIKYLMKSCKNLKGGLQDVADDLGIKRFGPQHQAGSDSLLTAGCFFEMKKRYFGGEIDDENLGILFGLNLRFPDLSPFPPTGSSAIPIQPARGPPLPSAASAGISSPFAAWRLPPNVTVGNPSGGGVEGSPGFASAVRG